MLVLIQVKFRLQVAEGLEKQRCGVLENNASPRPHSSSIDLFISVAFRGGMNNTLNLSDKDEGFEILFYTFYTM